MNQVFRHCLSLFFFFFTKNVVERVDLNGELIRMYQDVDATLNQPGFASQLIIAAHCDVL